MCCACAGSCSHVGNHTYCAAHGGTYVGAATPPVTLVYPQLTADECPALLRALIDEVKRLRVAIEGTGRAARRRAG